MRFFSILLLILSFVCTVPEEIKAEAASQEKQQTLSIIKPDAVAANHIGEIISRFESQNLRVAAIAMRHLTHNQAEAFYAAHKGKPFFPGLVKFMSSGPIVVMVLEGLDAVAKNRQIMGMTDPKSAAQGSLRADFGRSIGENAVHGSDSVEAANLEIAFFFAPNQIFAR